MAVPGHRSSAFQAGRFPKSTRIMQALCAVSGRCRQLVADVVFCQLLVRGYQRR
jgi:hypothetical protein